MSDFIHSDEQDNDPNSHQRLMRDYLTLLTFKLQEYREEWHGNQDKEQPFSTNPHEFSYWLYHNLRFKTVGDLVAATEDCNVLVSSIERFVDILSDSEPQARKFVSSLWYLVVAASRPTPTNRVKSVYSMTVVKWENGCFLPFLSVVPALVLPDAGGNDPLITDLDVCQVADNAAKSVGSVLAEASLDELATSQSQSISENAYDVLMGLILLTLNGATITHPTSAPKGATLNENLREECRRLFEVIKMMVNPPLKQIAGRMTQAEAAGMEIKPGDFPNDPNEKPDTGDPAGGWNG